MLVHGAGGGVGTASLQVAKGARARSTIALVSSQEKARVASEAGADETVHAARAGGTRSSSAPAAASTSVIVVGLLLVLGTPVRRRRDEA